MMKMNKFSKIAIALLSLLLVLTVGFAGPLQVFAQATNVTYLSDIKLYCAENSSEAKAGLEGEGYTFLPNNLNAGTGRDTGVYLGYKTTVNSDMAITDIRMLGMESGFQLYDYKQMVEYLKNEQSGTANTMLEAAVEFAQKYGADSPRAISAYKGLNLFYVDEAKMKLGDFIVAGNADIDFFMNMIFKSSTSTLNAVIGYLNAGITPYENGFDEEEGVTVSNNWALQLPESSVYEILQNNPTADELKEMKKQYNDNARETFKQIQKFVTEYENSVARNPKGEPKVNEQTTQQAIEAAADIKREDADIVYIKAFDKLNEYRYTDDMTIGEWILNIGHQTSDEIDLTKLYPLVDVMSDAQNDIVGDTGFLSAVSNLAQNKKEDRFENTLNDVKKAIKEYNGSETLSVWDNADDDLQNSKIAFTSEAVRRQAAGNILIRHDERDVLSEQFELVSKWVSFAIGVLSVAVFAAAKIITAIATPATAVAMSDTLISLINVVGVAGAIGMWVGVVAAVATIALLLYFWIKSLIEEDDDPEEYIELPGYVIDAQVVAGGDTETVRYKTVLSNIEHDGKFYGDLNGWEESRWNTICYTKDSSVGSPIRMDEDNNIFKVVEGDAKTPDGYAPLRPFGERSAGNCNSFCKKDSVGGIFIFYRTDKSVNNESPDSAGSDAQEQQTQNGYIASLIVATADSEAQAKAKINKQSVKYFIFDRNLSPNMGYATYIGYTLTMNQKQAVTDIRVAPYNGNNSVVYGSSQYIFAGTVGVNMGSKESNASSQNDALLFTTDENAGSPILADSFHVANSCNEAKPGWEAVTPFACGIPYNFNVKQYDGYSGNKGNYVQKDRSSDYYYTWDDKTDINLFFEPSLQYKSGEKYVSGVFFLSGVDLYRISQAQSGDIPSMQTDAFNPYVSKIKGMNNVKLNDVNITQSVNSFTNQYCRDLRTYMGYTFTCNPKRAIYDLALFQGTQYTPSLPYCVSKKQADNSTINYIASTTYVQNDLSVSGGTSFRGIGNFNSFMNNQGNVLNPEFCYFMLQSKHYTTHTSEFIDYGFTRTAFPTVGLYASGYSKSKNPLRVCDLVITQKEYAPNSDSESSFVKLEGENTLDGNKATGEFHSVTFIQSPHSVKAFDFGYPDFYCSQDNKLSGKGSHLYLYQRGAVQTKGKYISSIALGAYSKELYQNSVNSKKDQSSLDGIKFSADMYAMSSACSVSADEVIIKNLAINQSEAWYNSKGKFPVIVPDWKSKTHVHAKYEGDFAKQSTTPSDSDTAAYIGVTRTDNPKQAITGALLVQNDKWTTEKTIKIGRVVYYCDAIQTPMRVNGHNYYLYYTYNTGVNAGQPIEEISVDGNALVQGAATAVCAKDSDIDSERVTYADSSIPSFIHLYYDHSNLKSAFFNKLYIGTGKTKNAALLELAANECVEFVDLDLNDGASGESVYFGFRYGVLDRAAIKEKRDDDAKKAEQRAQMQEAICDVIVTEGEPYHPEGFIADNLVYYVPVADKNLNAGNLGDELYMYYTSDYVSSAYNKRNNAATYLAYDVFTPIKSFAFSRFDCVPYNEQYVSQTGENDLAVYEYVMRSDEKLPIDLNADILVTDGDYKAKGDNRISMFVSRLNNSVKPSAEITGGYVGKTTDVGTLKLTKKTIR